MYAYNFRRSWPSAIALASGMLLTSLTGAYAQDSSDWNSVLDAAKSEGKVVLYSTTHVDTLDRILAGFRKAYPEIQIEGFRAAANNLVPKVEQERATGTEGADVVIDDMTWVPSQAKAGTLLKPAGPDAEKWPGDYLLDGAAVLVGSEPFLIPYNTSLVKDPPKDFADLLRPEFKDRIGVSDLVAITQVGYYSWVEQIMGPDYLPKVKALNPKIYHGSNNMVQAIVAGEISVATYGISSSAVPLMQQGAPVNYVLPNPDLAFQYAAGAVNWSKHKNAALVLLDYLMSVEGQTVWHGNGQSVSPLNVPGSMQVENLSPLDVSGFTPEKVQAYTEHWNAIFK
jgi:iron(III) transport system substrate-binding protein